MDQESRKFDKIALAMFRNLLLSPNIVRVIKQKNSSSSARGKEDKYLHDVVGES
jgi:hypothetical protein